MGEQELAEEDDDETESKKDLWCGLRANEVEPRHKCESSQEAQLHCLNAGTDDLVIRE